METTRREDSGDFNELDRPETMPGTIAEREHRKWTEMAVAMQNNPYSRENIERRLSTTKTQQSGNKGFGPAKAASAWTSQTDVGRIDCGLRTVNASRYTRDYYVNDRGSGANGDKGGFSVVSYADQSREASSSVKDKPNHSHPRQQLRFEPKPEEVDEEEEDLEDSLEDAALKVVSSETEEEECVMAQDSGVGSSSERSSTLSKVESEIKKFQREIEHVAAERSKQQQWHLAKMRKGVLKSAVGKSVDNLTMDKVISEGILKRTVAGKKQQRRVSISALEAEVIGESDDAKAKEEEKGGDIEAKEEEDLATLPSVKELATRFMKDTKDSLKKQEVYKETVAQDRVSQLKEQFPKTRQIKEIHSLTARSVPRRFREDLKLGMPSISDRNIKLPSERKTSSGQDDHNNNAICPEKPPAVVVDPAANRSSLNIIYDSDNRGLVPYPDGEVIRTPSPESTGIPARPMRVVPRLTTAEDAYTSDESGLGAFNAKKMPSSLKRKPKRLG